VTPREVPPAASIAERRLNPRDSTHISICVGRRTVHAPRVRAHHKHLCTIARDPRHASLALVYASCVATFRDRVRAFAHIRGSHQAIDAYITCFRV